MLKYLQSNRPALLALALFLILAMGVWLVVVGPNPGPTGILEPFNTTANQGWLRALVLGVCLVFQTFLFYRTTNVGEVYVRQLPFSALVYAALTTAVFMRLPDVHYAISGVCLLLSVLHAVHVFRQPNVSGHVFESAFWAVLAVLVFPAHLPLLLFPIVALAYARNFAPMEWAALALGYAGAALLWFGTQFVFTSSISAPVIQLHGLGLPHNFGLHEALWVALVGLAGGVGAFRLLASYRDSSNRARNSKNQLVFALLCTLLGVFFSDPEWDWAQFRLWALPLALVLPFTVEPGRMAQRWFATCLLLLLAAVTVVAFLLPAL